MIVVELAVMDRDRHIPYRDASTPHPLVVVDLAVVQKDLAISAARDATIVAILYLGIDQFAGIVVRHHEPCIVVIIKSYPIPSIGRV